MPGPPTRPAPDAMPDPSTVAAATWARLGELFAVDPYANRIGAVIGHWAPGTATVTWTADTVAVNFAGGVHGGAIFSLADVALSVGCNAWGRVCVALKVDIELLAPPAVGDVLTAVCTERARRRQIGAYDIAVTGPGGTLVASCSALAFRTPRWHLGEDAWPEAWRAAV